MAMILIKIPCFPLKYEMTQHNFLILKQILYDNSLNVISRCHFGAKFTQGKQGAAVDRL